MGMTFSPPTAPPGYDVKGMSPATKNDVRIFLTRNGNAAESWDLHEELDRETDLGVEGLDGLFDLHGAVGLFGAVEFRIKFRRDQWLWRPRS